MPLLSFVYLRFSFVTLRVDAFVVHAVRSLSASSYFSPVLRNTSTGREGAGGFLFHLCASSQSRTNCLSNDGGLEPTRYWSRGQKREESGVRASSIRYSFPALSWPNSNFVSAIMMPRVAA